MGRTLLGLGTLLTGVALGVAAAGFFVTAIQPWQSSPDTTHVTLSIASLQFTGWTLFVPFAALALGAITLGGRGVPMLRSRD